MIGPCTCARHGLHGLEVAGRGDGEAGLDDVHAEVARAPAPPRASRRGSCCAPGDCSPSRRVVSKMMTRSGAGSLTGTLPFSVRRR